MSFKNSNFNHIFSSSAKDKTQIPAVRKILMAIDKILAIADFQSEYQKLLYPGMKMALETIHTQKTSELATFQNNHFGTFIIFFHITDNNP